jgi:serine/threonine protein kinase
MTQVFLSYSHQDTDRARLIRQALQRPGWTLWMDEALEGGQVFRQAIGKELANAECVVVLWSKSSVQSHWVIDEADIGLRRGILIPVCIDDLNVDEIPLGFQQLQTIRLPASLSHSETFQSLLSAVTRKLDTRPDTSPQVRVEQWRRARLQESLEGKYELEHELGRGGMATIYRAHDLQLDRPVAIKVASLDALFSKEGMYERWLREARTAARLIHRNILDIKAFEEGEQLTYFVMQFVDGRSLEDLIQSDGPMRLSDARSTASQIARGLAFAHQHGVIHRNLVPEKILISHSGRAVITDFGAAKVSWKTEGKKASTQLPTLAIAMSPELCEGGEATEASDQYALGVMIYGMLTGRPPFEGDSVLSILQQHCDGIAAPVTELRADCPADFSEVVLRMLAKNPEERWSSMRDAAIALDSVLLESSKSVIGQSSHHADGQIPTNQHDRMMETAKRSYQRCCANGEFLGSFYTHFLDSCPDFPPLFRHTDMDRQQRLLQHALSLLLIFPQDHGAEPTILSRVAERHSSRDLNIDPSYYSYFVESLLQTVREYDEEFGPEIELAWNTAVKPGIEYIASRY